MRRLPPVLLACALVLVVQAPVLAAPYSVEILRPGAPDGSARVRGEVLLRVRVDGLGSPSSVAYQLTEVAVPWADERAIAMTAADEGIYEARIRSDLIPNGTYRARVRAWGGSAGEYDPDDDGTYAADGIGLDVANPPPAPAGVVAEGGAGTLAASWEELEAAGRSDFAGYEVYLALADATGSCPPFGEVYSLRETTFATTHAEEGLPAARYCVGVVALRSAPDEPVASPPSAAVVADVSEGSGEDGGPDPTVSGGGYTPGLPYSPTTDASPVRELSGSEALEAGAEEGRNRWAFAAGGLVLAVLALLLGRYVRAAPDR